MFNKKRISELEKVVRENNRKIEQMGCKHKNVRFDYTPGYKIQQCIDCNKIITYYANHKTALIAEQKYLQDKLEAITNTIKGFE